MRTLIEHGVVLAGQELEYVPGAAVAVEDGFIRSVGDPPPGWEPDARVDASGRAVLPGLINAHTHSAMTLLRSYADDLPLQEWLTQKIWPAEAGLNGEYAYWGAMLAIVEMLRSGTTSFADMYFFMDEVAGAVASTGIRAALSYGMIGLDPAKAEKELAAGLEFARKFRGGAGGRITTMLAPHAPYTCPASFLREIVSAAEQEQLALHIHVSETGRENREMMAETGMTPTEYLFDAGLFKRHVLMAHGVWLTESDISLLAKHDVGVAHCPGSNLKLASGLAPVTALLAAGVPVGLGTDGAASNNRLNLLREVYLAALIHKVRENDATAVSARQALRMATTGGAACLGMEQTLGRLEAGCRADIIMLDLERPHLAPRHDPLSLIVYAAEGSDVTDVMVDGEFLLRQGQFILLDEERVVYEAGRMGLKLVSGR